MKKKLSSIFKKAAAGLALTLGASYGAMAATGRPLQPEEKNIVHSIFGDGVNTNNVRLHFMDKRIFGKSGITLFNQVWIFGKSSASENFGKDLFPDLFVHEMTHVWQFQHGKVRPDTFCRTYDYDLKPDSKFSDFCIEQQASMVERYSLRFLYPGDMDFMTSVSPESDRLLKKVVETQFPRARELRLFREEQQKKRPARALGG